MSITAFKYNVTSLTDNALRYVRQGVYVLGAVAGSYAMSGCDKDKGGVEPKGPEVTLPTKIENVINLSASYSGYGYVGNTPTFYISPATTDNTTGTLDANINPTGKLIVTIANGDSLRENAYGSTIIMNKKTNKGVEIEVKRDDGQNLGYYAEAQFKAAKFNAQQITFEGDKEAAKAFLAGKHSIDPVKLNGTFNGKNINFNIPK